MATTVARLSQALGAAACAFCLGTGPVHAQSYDVDAGTLTCEAEGSVSFVFGSTRDIVCTFQKAGGGTEQYAGSIDNYGLDIGFQNSAVLIWGVVTANPNLPAGSLAGTFSGISANIAAGIGVGAKALVAGGAAGGDGPQIALQPIAVQGTTGLNLAAGVTTVTLRPM